MHSEVHSTFANMLTTTSIDMRKVSFWRSFIPVMRHSTVQDRWSRAPTRSTKSTVFNSTAGINISRTAQRQADLKIDERRQKMMKMIEKRPRKGPPLKGKTMFTFCRSRLFLVVTLFKICNIYTSLHTTHTLRYFNKATISINIRCSPSLAHRP